jgi:hypothetical protein
MRIQHQSIKPQQPNTNQRQSTYLHTLTLSQQTINHPQHIPKMSFLFGQGRPQPSSAEKIAAAEAEIEMVSNMFNQ